MMQGWNLLRILSTIDYQKDIEESLPYKRSPKCPCPKTLVSAYWEEALEEVW